MVNQQVGINDHLTEELYSNENVKYQDHATGNWSKYSFDRTSWRIS